VVSGFSRSFFMRAVVQRVASAAVAVDNRTVGQIDRGLLVFVGVERGDSPEDAAYIASKVRDLRVFEDPIDESRHLNRSVVDVGGAVLLVSQFTLAGDCRKGRRPSFDAAAPPAIAEPLYEDVVRELRRSGVSVATGTFQAMMHVSLVNDGPVTLLLDSRRRF
jgi:D-aminoacyl-tRNA deacylase